MGIDTSGFRDGSIVLGLCFFKDPKAGYVFLEKHLKLPKSHDLTEFKWAKINPRQKEKFQKKIHFVLKYLL